MLKNTSVMTSRSIGFGACLAVAVLAAGCTTGAVAYCDSTVTGMTTLNNQFGSCDAGALPNGPLGPYCTNLPGCIHAYDACSGADQKILTALGNCVTAQTACTPGQENQWINQYNDCVADAGTVSAACTAFFTAQNPDGGC